MIDDRILLFFVITVLTFVFDHKILPQVGLWILSLVEIYLGITSTTLAQADVVYIFLFVINLLYITFMIFVAPMEENPDETQ